MSRRLLEHDAGAPPLAVETEIDEIRLVVLDHAAHRAAPRTLGAAHLEHVGEIIVEGEREEQLHPLGAEVSHGKTVKQGGAPYKGRPRHMQEVLRKDEAP